jgi:hypothetical protein
MKILRLDTWTGLDYSRGLNEGIFKVLPFSRREKVCLPSVSGTGMEIEGRNGWQGRAQILRL